MIERLYHLYPKKNETKKQQALRWIKENIETIEQHRFLVDSLKNYIEEKKDYSTPVEFYKNFYDAVVFCAKNKYLLSRFNFNSLYQNWPKQDPIKKYFAFSVLKKKIITQQDFDDFVLAKNNYLSMLSDVKFCLNFYNFCLTYENYLKKESTTKKVIDYDEYVKRRFGQSRL